MTEYGPISVKDVGKTRVVNMNDGEWTNGESDACIIFRLIVSCCILILIIHDSSFDFFPFLLQVTEYMISILPFPFPFQYHVCTSSQYDNIGADV